MNLADLVFVTSNEGKRREAEAVLGVALAFRDLDLAELQSLDLHAIVRAKAAAAHAAIGGPVLVEDTGLELLGLGGFPGPLVRWLLASTGPDGICRLAAAFGDHRAVARCVACASDGEDTLTGEGAVLGTIAVSPRGTTGFGWDSTFIPDGGDGRTFAEMSGDEKNAVSHRRKAFLALREALDRTAC
ncbi:MAG: non-canonical purine NTP pyrophosphatase [Thermoanaerobaculales bacterium]|nr:non-canonical purine NTP pyrophosphatase [Thermoanaerobaculales bacterium]